MAKKSGFFGTLATLGAIAGATAAVYYKRGEIKDILDQVMDRFIKSDDTVEAEFQDVTEERDIVIDTTKVQEED